MCYTAFVDSGTASVLATQVMRLRLAVPKILGRPSVPPRLPFHKNRPLSTPSESTLPQLLIPLHFNSPRINTYKKAGEGVPPSSPKVLQLVNSMLVIPSVARNLLFPWFASHSSLTPSPFRITSFADPHHLTLIKSHSYKKQGRGGVRDLLPICFHTLAHSFAPRKMLSPTVSSPYTLLV